MERTIQPEFDLIIGDRYEEIVESGIVIPSLDQLLNNLDNRVSYKFEIEKNRIDIFIDSFGTSSLQHMTREEWYQYLVDNHLFFSDKGRLINVPLIEVW